MRQTALPLNLIAMALACALSATAAQAQTAPIRVFVAPTGSDSNPCTFASPCKSAQHAHDVVAAGGEMRMLDPGSYGLLTITKAISILGDGHGGIAASNGATAITINAGTTDQVNLRGLVIEGFGSGGNGIVFNTGGSLNIQSSIVRNFTTNGIQFTASTTSALNVSRTHVSDLAPGGSAVLISPSASASVTAVLNHVRLNHGYHGLAVAGNGGGGSISVTVAHSVISNGAANGIEAQYVGAAVAVDVRDSAVTNNAGVGLQAASSNVIRVTRSKIAGNGTGWSGGVLSYGDNDIDGNASGNGLPSGVPHK